MEIIDEPYYVSLWKHIRNGWETFSKFVKFKVGNGFLIRFGMIHGVGR